MNKVTKARDLAAGALFVFAGWWLLAVLVRSPALPDPGLATADFARMLASGELGPHLWRSSWRVLFSLGFSLVSAVPLGLVTGRNQGVDRFLAPVVYLLYPVPKIVLLPIIMVLAGIGETAKISVIILIIFFQILVTTRDASRSISSQTFMAVRSLGANHFDIYRHVVWPSCLPAVLSGMRVSLGTAISVLFFAETVAGTSGLGYLVLDAWHRADYGEMFAAILGMSLLGLGLYYAIDYLERWWCRWQFL